MVTVLVPTGTPFPADRRSEAERHYFGHGYNGGRGNVTAAEPPSRPILPSRRSCSARVGSGGCSGLRSGSPARSPSRSVSGSPTAATRSGESSRRSSRWGRMPSEPMNTRVPHQGEPADPATHYACQQTETRARLPTARATTCHILRNPIPSGPARARLGRGRLAWRPTHPPSGPAVQTPQMDLGQGCCLLMSGVDCQLEQDAGSGGVPTPPPPLIQQTELNGREGGGT